MTPPDPAREAAILARCEAATPGPWDHKIPTDGATHELTRCVWAKALGIPVAQSLAHHDFPEDEGFIQEQALANAHFIAHAREDVPYLLAQLAAARARAERAEGAIEDAAVLLDALGQMHATQLIRQGRTDGRDDFGPEVRAASDRWRAFRALAARGE